MRRRTGGLVALGAAAYLAFLVALLPARVVTSRITLPPGVALDAVEGTVWHGHATVSAPALAPQAALDLDWRWRPLALLSGRFAYDVLAHGAGLQARAVVAQGVRLQFVEDLTLEADAAAIAQWVPLASAWQPTGRVRARAGRLAWDGRALQGEAQAQWDDAALALSSVRPVGDYAIRMEAAGGPARIAVTTVKGPLRITGDGTLDAMARFAFTGEARAEGPQADALAPLLDLLGPRRPDGSRALRFAT